MVFAVVGRGVFLLLAYGGVTALCFRVTGADVMPRQQRRRMARLQQGLTALLFLAWVGESLATWFAWPEVAAAGSGWAALLWPSAWAVFPSVILLSAAVGCALIFYRNNWPTYRQLVCQLEAMEQAGDEAPDLAVLEDIRQQSETLMACFPPGGAWLCRGFHERLGRMMQRSAVSEPERRAVRHLRGQRPREALRALLGCKEMRAEALLLALDTGNWNEAARLGPECRDPALRLDCGQLLVERARVDEYRQVGHALLADEKYRRRRAALALRHGDPDQARALVADDEEALRWLSNDESVTRAGEGEDSKR